MVIELSLAYSFFSLPEYVGQILTQTANRDLVFGRFMAKKVLVVEDNDDILYLMVFHLQTAGYEVLAARDGHEAVQQAKDHCPDIILMDVGLPQMDGLEATRLIKSTEHCIDTPVIALTAYRDLREKALAAGCARSCPAASPPAGWPARATSG